MESFYRKITALPGDQAPIFMVRCGWGLRAGMRCGWGCRAGAGSGSPPPSSPISNAGPRRAALRPRAARRALLRGHCSAEHLSVHRSGVPEQVRLGPARGSGLGPRQQVAF